MQVPVSSRSVYTQLEELFYFRLNGEPARRTMDAALRRDTSKAMWKVSASIWTEAAGMCFCDHFQYHVQVKISIWEVSGKPKPGPGVAGTLGITGDPRWRRKDFCGCASATWCGAGN